MAGERNSRTADQMKLLSVDQFDRQECMFFRVVMP